MKRIIKWWKSLKAKAQDRSEPCRKCGKSHHIFDYRAGIRAPVRFALCGQVYLAEK